MAQKWPFSCDMPNFAFIKGIDLIHFLHISLMEMDFLCRKHMFLVFNGNIFFNLLYFPTTAHIVNVHRPRDEFLSKMTSSDFQFALRQKTLHAEISSWNVLMGHHNIFFDSSRFGHWPERPLLTRRSFLPGFLSNRHVTHHLCRNRYFEKWPDLSIAN